MEVWILSNSLQSKKGINIFSKKGFLRGDTILPRGRTKRSAPVSTKMLSYAPAVYKQYIQRQTEYGNRDRVYNERQSILYYKRKTVNRLQSDTDIYRI